ncbi:MAG TPA: class I SAM-dependent methyltransferase [Saprospiraceae bacterium]|nr:class I SAM-dependent methyltransferase [Saprospiraceae bacterium]
MNIENMNCKICNAPSKEIFTAKILSKYDAKYFQCTECKFIQTEHPYWLDEAYNSAITHLDLGLIFRNNAFKYIVFNLINIYFDKKGKFIDYGGGYGMFVRLERDLGLDFYRQDKYCENLFAKYFDIEDLPRNTKFEILTTFEVFEHLQDPIIEIEKMLTLSDNILFSTELQPRDIENLNPSNWHYILPEIGQHIALYSIESLQYIAKKYNLNLYSSNSIHLLTKKKLSSTFFRLNTNFKLSRALTQIIPKNTLIMRDFSFIKEKLGVKP